MRWLGAGLAAAMALAAGAAQAEKTARDEFSAIAKAMTEGRCDVPRIKALIARPDFDDLGGRGRSIVYVAQGLCDRDGQHEAALKATAEPGALSMAWGLRFMDAVQRDDMTDALAALHAAARSPSDQSFQVFNDQTVYRAARTLRADPVRFRQLLADLDLVGWTPQSAGYENADWLWSDYAAMLAADGRTEEATRLVLRMAQLGELAALRLDKRFDAVLAAHPERADVRAAAEARLAWARDKLAANPRDGSAVSISVDMLRILGRTDEALALIDQTLRLSGKIVDHNGEEHRRWLVDDRSTLLVDLGRFDEALKAMQDAAARGEHGGPNVSQTINLAGQQQMMGQPQATLDTLAVFGGPAAGKTSPYGQMWVEAERACAHHRLGHDDAGASSLAYVKAHAADNPSAQVRALFCLQDLDGLAAVYIARLKDEVRVREALMELSQFVTNPVRTPLDREYSATMARLRARPDLQAAVAAVGRLGDFPVHPASMTDAY